VREIYGNETWNNVGRVCLILHPNRYGLSVCLLPRVTVITESANTNLSVMFIDADIKIENVIGECGVLPLWVVFCPLSSDVDSCPAKNTETANQRVGIANQGLLRDRLFVKALQQVPGPMTEAI
jgi:hypothetical protein